MFNVTPSSSTSRPTSALRVIKPQKRWITSLIHTWCSTGLLTFGVVNYHFSAALASSIPLTEPLASPSHVHLAQQVVDRLPPPPPIPDLVIPDPTSEASDVPIGSGPSPEDDSTGELYMVYVNGDSPLLLQQVQQVEPTASIQPYEDQTVILVGMFDRSSAANEQVQSLDERGIQADVASVSRVVLTPASPATSAVNLDELPPADLGDLAYAGPPVSIDPPATSTTPVSPTRSSTTNRPELVQAPPPSNPDLRDSAYYVVIPGQSDTLMALQEQVMLLGAVPTAVVQRERPIGPHLLVGPFVDQGAASRWNRFFRDFGMDARVYYKR